MNISKEMIEKAHKEFNTFDRITPSVIPTPTRSFNVGDECQVGHLKDCVIAEVLFDGKAYRVDCISVDNNYGRGKIETPKTGIWWWFDVEPREFFDRDAEQLFADPLPGQVQVTSIDSLFHMMSFNGIVCDPKYQREYVWTIEDQRALIDSIFNRINIGSLIFSRHAGYLKGKTAKLITYINLDGDEVQITENKDYTCAIIDGQQRLTTLWRFYTNQFTYKGRYYKDLHPKDQGEFRTSLISTRQFDDDSVSYKDVLRMFIRVNRGVPQNEDHLKRVKEQLLQLES